jgi:hypothetical protein
VNRRLFMALPVALLATVMQASSEKAPARIQDLMSSQELRQCGLHKLTPSELAALNYWLTQYTIKIFQPSSPKPSATPSSEPIPRSYSWDSFHLLEGAWIIANDRKPLGRITRNSFDAESLMNEFGDYGNEFNGNSIFNQFGNYGNPFSALSPFNQFTSTPPKIYLNDRFMAYFTANGALAPRVDPELLIAWLKANR